MLSEVPFTKENLDKYLKELAKEFRRSNGKSMPAEIILVGGASVLINYGFREITYDMDAIINASSSMKDAINHVGDKFGLPNGWMNADFMSTESYTPRIKQFSEHYRTYSNVVSFRTVTREYLLAMKLMSGRQYKYDLSDVIGILREHETKGHPITFDKIKKAAADLYDSYDRLPPASRDFLEKAMAAGAYDDLYELTRKMESENKDILVEYQKEKPGVIKSDNVSSILEAIRKRKNRQ